TTSTTVVFFLVSSLLGQTTFFSSLLVSRKNFATFAAKFFTAFFALATKPGFLSVLSAIVLRLSYLVSRWTVCFLQKRQYFFISRRSGLFFLFFVVRSEEHTSELQS